jgi:Zn-dependent M28 family amino/carboxypeptidase
MTSRGSPAATSSPRSTTRWPEEVVVVGAHYDAHGGAPGVDDNASGVAATLAQARAFAGSVAAPDRTLRFVLFVNAEAPFFQTDAMGSRVYGRRCRARREALVAMLSLETIGYDTSTPGSQKFPFPLGAIYPDRGDIIGFAGDVPSRDLVRRVVGSFRRHASFPSEGAALPSGLRGVGRSDQWSSGKRVTRP